MWATYKVEINFIKVKVKVHTHTLDIALVRSESPPQKRSGMARRVLEGFWWLLAATGGGGLRGGKVHNSRRTFWTSCTWFYQDMVIIQCHSTTPV